MWVIPVNFKERNEEYQSQNNVNYEMFELPWSGLSYPFSFYQNNIHIGLPINGKSYKNVTKLLVKRKKKIK